jgi:light-regulated signal transduction histidine kinase (bacteriophytochrome)
VDGMADFALALAIDAARFLPVPLDVMLRGALAKLAGRLREGHVEVVYGDLPTVRGDADRLLQLFEYLIDDALRHRVAERPDIQLAAEVRDGEWLFTMRDHCASGIAADCQDNAFTPFARIHAGQRPGPGLATCAAIVERHGGRIWGESDDAGGCLWRFTLPGS